MTAIDGTTLTVDGTDFSGASTTMTVESTDETSVTETVDGALSDLSVGDTVIVMGEETDGGLTASSISESSGASGFGGGPGAGGGPPQGGGLPDGAELPEGVEPPEGFDPGDAPQGGGPRGGFTAGTITVNDGSMITIGTADGSEVAVSVTDDTTITISEERSFDDIEIGDTVRANGETEGSVVTATSIQIGDLGAAGFPGRRPDAASDSDDESAS